MVETSLELQDLIDAHTEWLLVRENGKTFSLTRSEIEFSTDDNGMLVGVLDEGGYKYSRINSASFESDELELSITGKFRKDNETLRLVPRTPASELTANIELARLEEANRIAAVIGESFPEYTVKRVGLHREN